MTIVTRKGDDSPVTHIEFLLSEKGISICVHPGQVKHDSTLRESVRFCTANGGGRSSHAYSALAAIEKEVAISKISTLEGIEGGRVIFMRGRGDPDFWLKTNNPLSSNSDQFYGATVFFPKDCANYALAARLLEAVQEDNRVRPFP